MITLNLVSQELKKEIKLRHIYGSLKKIGLIMALIALILSIIFEAAKYIMQKKFVEITEQTTLVTGNGNIYTQKAKNINARIEAINQIQKEYAAWSEFIKIIAANTPEKITLNYFKINKNDSTINLKGRAATRDELVAFKNNLEKLDFLSTVDLPIKNMLEKENIIFEINTKFNLEKIKELE